ncbi:hypothetical protein E4T56_gene2440 [Termitomyces sp. T112]|nr:hypothetical protein E4T56_gene2440 [Termitomyces sp. T112]
MYLSMYTDRGLGWRRWGGVRWLGGMAQCSDSVPVNVCRLVKCNECGKTTWTGCGQHAEAVMQGVKEEDKCVCARE